MTIIALDDELNALKSLELALREAAPEADLHCFQWPEDVLTFAAKCRVDAAFLDIETGSISGLALAKQLTALHPRCNIIFATGYDDYRGDALDMYASGYVKKPVRVERIIKELQNLRHQNEDKRKQLGAYRIDHAAQRVYFDGQDTLLTPKEFQLFCLFADNVGSFFSPAALYRVIWGDDPNHNVRTVYKHISKLRTKLHMNGNCEYDIEASRGEGYRLSR